jgi:excisionase family DNA binding protein
MTTLSRTTLYAARRDGRLRAAKVGRRVLVAVNDLLEFLGDPGPGPRGEPNGPGMVAFKWTASVSAASAVAKTPERNPGEDEMF